MKPAARRGDMLMHIPLPTQSIKPINTGIATVLIGGNPGACRGHGNGIDIIVQGSSTVFINGLPAARVGDMTGTGGIVMGPGAVNVLIGG